MFVLKRDGREEPVCFDKITTRIGNLTTGLHPSVDPAKISQKVISGIYSGVTTKELDALAANTAAAMAIEHPDFARLAGRIVVSDLHKSTPANMLEYAEKLKDSLAENVYDTILEAHEELDRAIDHNIDFETYDFFGFKTLERSYLLRVKGVIVERPQHLYMRVALGIHGADLPAALETYELLSHGYLSHATPTLYNAGTRCAQMSSCFLLQVQDDSVQGIYNTLQRCALISKSAGGIGLSISNVRSAGAAIKGTGGVSNGLLPMLRVFDASARYIDQGGNRRPGAIAVYIEPHHPDILEVLQLKRATGKEELRARDLFYGLWASDLFMRRVKADEMWSLFCPDECPDLDEAYGEEYEARYLAHEAAGRAKKRIKAQDVWFAVLESQIESGGPYLLFKDQINRKNNQKNLGVIKCSNLCAEIVQFVGPDEVAVCNLASLCLPRFVDATTKEFNFDTLRYVVGVAVKNLNRIIDVNVYPIPEARKSNLAHRPIGIGVQGLADVFAMLQLPFESPEARTLNARIFENIYHAALSASCTLAARDGVYESYQGSPASLGVLQFDMWPQAPPRELDWAPLRERIAEHGLRNSLLVALMPTASTASILGNCESFEPFTSNVFTRRVLAGEFLQVNKHLVKELDELGLWTSAVRDQVVAAGGSVQGIAEIPSLTKQVFKTAWEISMRTLIDLSADRGAFTCQTQSFNAFVAKPTFARLSSMHLYSWERGLKTGMYYLRSKAASEPMKVTCSIQNRGECETCTA